MSSQNYIADTLELPQQIPLFRYNVNFNGLKKLLEQSNIQTITNTDSIKKLNEQVSKRYSIQQFKAHEKILNNSINFGVNIQKYVDKQQSKFMNIKIDPKQTKTNSEEFAFKLSKMNQIVDRLLSTAQEHEQRIQSNDNKHQNLINDSFKRLQDRLDQSIQSFSKTINNYFGEANKKTSNIQTEFNILKITQDNKLKEMENQLSNKISSTSLDASLQGYKHKIIKQMNTQIENDQMKRFAALQQYSNQLKQLQKNIELQNKVTKQKVNELDQKVKTALPVKTFDMQKHKIYQKLSQFKNKTDQLARKNNEFVQFRKNYLSEKEKMKQEIIGIQDQMKKLNDKESSFKKMENVNDILQKLDPHLICEIGNQVKLHEKEIGKLQKKIMTLQAQAKQGKSNNVQAPQVNSGQNSQMIQKIIKQYMSNMDFQGRLKKAERDVQEISRRTDTFHDLQKKIYNLSKDLDVSALTKELKKKCDEQNTKKQLKIVDSKIQSLFDFFKALRKQMEIIYKRTALNVVKDNPDNPSLTSKKLIAANCLSCTSSTKRRTFSRQKLDFSFDESHDYLKSTTYQKFK